MNTTTLCSQIVTKSHNLHIHHLALGHGIYDKNVSRTFFLFDENNRSLSSGYFFPVLTETAVFFLYVL